MSVRKLTLDEWFLDHQLRIIKKNHFHIPIMLEANLGKLFRSVQTDLPLTSVLVKAAGLLLRSEPQINKQLFQTPIGPRVLEFQQNSVNLPVLLDINGQKYLSATTIKNADTTSVQGISKQIKDYILNGKNRLVIGRYLVGKKNTFFNRLRLRVIYCLINNNPWLFAKKGVGGIGVSSLLNLDHHGAQLNCVAYGANVFSICATSFDQDTKVLKLGIGWDHSTVHGYIGINAAMNLIKILESLEAKDLE